MVEIVVSQINPQKRKGKMKAVEKEIRSTYKARNTQNAAQDIFQKEKEKRKKRKGDFQML